jgi:HEAT repeat protein
VRTLIVLVASCAVILWSLRNLWENYDPVRVENRSLQRKAIASLRSAKPDERLAGIKELERLQPNVGEGSILPLVGALEDPDTAVRLSAASALDTIGTLLAKSKTGGEAISTAATGLIRCLKDPDPEIRVAALKALGSIGRSLWGSRSGGEIIRTMASAFEGCLKDPEPKVRAAAATSLGGITPPRPGLVAFAPIERQPMIDSLTAMLDDQDASVRRAAIQALAMHPMAAGDPPQALVRGLKDESAQNRAAAVMGLYFFPQGLDPWVPMLLRLAEQDPDPDVRQRCFVAMNNAFKPPGITAAVVPSVTASLMSPDARVRSQSALILSTLKADALAAIPQLIRVLNEPLDPKVEAVRGPGMNLDPASESAYALGQIAPGSAQAKQAIAALAEAASSVPVSRRGWAAVALGKFGPDAEEAVPVLIKVMSDAAAEGTFEREPSAAQALGMIAPETASADKAIVALLPLVDSKRPLTRATAIGALGQFGPKAAAALPRIRALKEDRDRDVREAAVKALPLIEAQRSK